MKRCLIITAHLEAPEALQLDAPAASFVICADAGLSRAEALGIRPDLLIGDFDSETAPVPPDGCEVIQLPAEKDMTDTEAAVDLAVSRGYTEITCLGGLGGRLDHTLGNLGMLAKYCGKGMAIDFVDGINRVTMRSPGTYTIPASAFHYLGFFAWGGPVTGLTLSGTRYPLQDFTLQDDTSRCVSNEITGDQAVVSFRTGRLLVIESSDLK